MTLNFTKKLSVHDDFKINRKPNNPGSKISWHHLKGCFGAIQTSKRLFGFSVCLSLGSAEGSKGADHLIFETDEYLEFSAYLKKRLSVCL